MNKTHADNYSHVVKNYINKYLLPLKLVSKLFPQLFAQLFLTRINHDVLQLCLERVQHLLYSIGALPNSLDYFFTIQHRQQR